MKGNGVVALRCEEKNKWERRAPLAPKHVSHLVKEGIKVIVAPSPNRCFSDSEYEKAGAIIQSDLSQAGTIIGVKEVPIHKLKPNRTYLFFAHIIKAQEYNMPLMDEMLAKNIRLIDYECIRSLTPPNPRLVAFGEYAGIAGMADFFRGLGEFLLQLGYATPFIHQGSCYMYPDLKRVQDSITTFGEMIDSQGLPPSLCPMVFGFTSNGKIEQLSGRVSKGAQKIFNLLPHEYVDPDSLDELMGSPPPDSRFKVYGTIIEARHMVQPKDHSKPFDKQEYYAKPELYEPVFHLKYAKHMSVLVNCMFWDYKFPRVLTRQQQKELVESGQSRLLGVCDITCDYMGSIEFLTVFTSIQEPFVVYDPIKMEVKMKINDATDNFVLFHAVDHLPAELPKEATTYFGDCLLPFMKDIILSDGTVPYEELKDVAPQIKNACVLYQGELTPNYKYIEKLRVYNATLQSKDEEQKAVEALGPHNARIIKLYGHLFDKMLFNKVLDVLEEMKLSFRVIKWDIGLTVEEQSHVSLKVIEGGDGFEKASSIIKKICEELGGEYSEN